jgi:hypothetical protein
MRGRITLPCLVVAAWLVCELPAAAQFQFSAPPPAAPERDALQASDTFVSFIDNALPRSQGRLYFDDVTRIRRPTRAGYLLPDLPLPETSVDFTQLTTYGEVAIIDSLSMFLTTPMLFLNPDVNRNYWGLSNMDVGVKWAFLNTANFLGTLQFRTYVPTAVNSALDMHQFSMEPALLFNANILDCFTLEGEGKYWFPISDNYYNGQVLTYGLGLAYGQRDPSSIWITPVIEGIGWSVLSGRELVPGPMPAVMSSRGEFIFNLYGGIRFGLGNNMSVYAGYGHSLTGDYWYKDVWRLEFRLFF